MFNLGFIGVVRWHKFEQSGIQGLLLSDEGRLLCVRECSEILGSIPPILRMSTNWFDIYETRIHFQLMSNKYRLFLVLPIVAKLYVLTADSKYVKSMNLRNLNLDVF